MGPRHHPCNPPRTGWDLFYFVPRTSANMKNGCHHHQIGMDSLCDVIFKMADVEIKKFTSRHISASRIPRNMILVSIPMFFKMKNPMAPFLEHYNSYLHGYSRWLTISLDFISSIYRKTQTMKCMLTHNEKIPLFKIKI